MNSDSMLVSVDETKNIKYHKIIESILSISLRHFTDQSKCCTTRVFNKNLLSLISNYNQWTTSTYDFHDSEGTVDGFIVSLTSVTWQTRIRLITCFKVDGNVHFRTIWLDNVVNSNPFDYFRLYLNSATDPFHFEIPEWCPFVWDAVRERGVSYFSLDPVFSMLYKRHGYISSRFSSISY